MSQSQALSEDQVGQELKKMTAFIKQEAMEKSREIEIKADEEFAIEKSKLVRQETSSIDTSYEKKFKQAQMSQQITRSTVANKTRLKVLSARQELLDDIYEAAEKRLGEATKDQKKYQEILKNLIVEGFYALNEPKVQIRGRKKDEELIKKAIEGAVKVYNEKTGRETSATFDEKNPLPEGGAGGVSILGGGGKIEINNTFEQRLNLLKDSSLPAVREALFGKNENRKFYD